MRIMDLHAMPLAYSNLDLNKQHQKQMNSFIKNELIIILINLENTLNQITQI